MQIAKFQTSLHIWAVLPEPVLFAYVSGRSRVNLSQRSRRETSLRDWTCVLRCGAVVKHRTRDREVPGSIPTNIKCCFLEQETLSTLLSTGFYPGKKRATWKISTSLLNVLSSINKVDYYYYYYYWKTEWTESPRSLFLMVWLILQSR